MNEPLSASRLFRGPIVVVPALAALSWLGMIIHNAEELPDLTLGNLEELGPTLVSIVLVALFLLRPDRTSTALLFGWTLLHLVGGGILSVLPLPFLPFTPAQTPSHYAAHVVYSLAQLPLLAYLWPRLRQSR
jgi:hypothetical protein